MIGHEGGGRAGGAEGREKQAGQLFPGALEAESRLAGLRDLQTRLHHRDERRHGGEGKLETHPEHRLRLPGHDGEHGEGQVAHGQSAPVEDDGAEHDQRHDQRAFGPDARPGAKIVGAGAQHRDDGRELLDRNPQRQNRDQSQQTTRDDEENPGDQRHLHAGDGDDMENAGFADQVFCVLREKIALAGDHGRADGALVAANRRTHPQSQTVADSVHRREP